MLQRSLLVLSLLLLPFSVGYADETPTYRFAVTDIVGLEELQREYKKFQEILKEKTGVKLKLFPVTGRTVVVEAFRSGRLDLALTGPAEYVALASRVPVQPVVGLFRPEYSSVVLARKDSEIQSIEDLKGKKVAFGDFGSTSYHLAPLQLLKDGGLEVNSEIEKINISKHVAFHTLVRGQVAALGFSKQRFEQFLDEDDSVAKEDFIVLAEGPHLPSDLIVASRRVPEEVVMRLRKAFEKDSEEILEAILVGQRNQKYSDIRFQTALSDSDYDYVRKMYQTAGLEHFSKDKVNS